MAARFGRHGRPMLPPSLMTFDRLTFKLVCESHIRWETFLSNSGTLGLWVIELFAIYANATDRQTDGRTDGQKQRLLSPSLRERGHDNYDFCVLCCSRGRENSVASVIMMYSPDIPTASPGKTTGDSGRVTCRQASVEYSSSIENYYARIETEESVKCVVSSVIFFLVLLAFVLIAILFNPEM